MENLKWYLATCTVIAHAHHLFKKETTRAVSQLHYPSTGLFSSVCVWVWCEWNCLLVSVKTPVKVVIKQDKLVEKQILQKTHSRISLRLELVLERSGLLKFSHKKV